MGEMSKDLAALSLNDRLLSQLTCPLCLETATPPIFMCVNGHHVCNACKKKIVECSLCRAPGSPDIRNFVVEEMSRQLRMPCVNARLGCVAGVAFGDVAAHSESCDYRYRCLLMDCDWQGAAGSLREHVVANHPGYLIKGGTNLTYTINVDHGMNCLTLVPFREKLFWCSTHYVGSTKMMHFYSKFVGPNSEAADYKCTFTLLSPDGDHTVAFTSVTHHIDEVSTNTDKSAHLHRGTLPLFISKKSKINVSHKMSLKNDDAEEY